MERLRHIREQAGYSQQDLADESGVSQHTISEIELGRRKPQGRTLRKLAGVLGVEVRDFFEEARPLAQAPPEPSFNDVLAEERRAAWVAAARNARQLREHGEDRMEVLLSSWRDSRDRGALREMGPLLNEAEAAKNALMDNLEAGLAAGDREAAKLIAAGAQSVPNSGWEEFIAADRCYRSLFDMVLKAGLSVRRERKPDREVHEVEEAA